MSTVETIFLSVFIIHALVGIFNFGAAVAYLTRRKVEYKLSFFRVLFVYTVAVAGFILGVFTIPSTFSAVEWPTYGWKLWWGELPRDNCKWYYRKREERLRMEHEAFMQKMRQEGGTDGACESIW